MTRKDSPAQVRGGRATAGEALTRLESTFGRPTARFNPLGFIWSWRYELALALVLPAIIIALTLVFGRIGPLAALATIILIAVAVVVLPPARHRFMKAAWRLITPHLLRSGFAHARIKSRTGRIPFVVRSTSEPFGERVLVWCPAGTSAEDLRSAQALLRAATWADDVRITRSARYAQMVTVDVIRRSPPRTSAGWLAGHDDNDEVPHRPRSTEAVGPRRPSGGTAAAGGDGSVGGPYAGGRVPLAKRRYLKGQYPDSVPVGEPFSLLASIVLAVGPSSAALKLFAVPPEGRDVLLAAHAPGLRLLTHQRLTVHVPADGDSEPVMFDLRADEPGVHTVSLTAWIGGSYLGELLIDITAERDHPVGIHRAILAEMAAMEPTDGAVSLVVRFDPRQNAYRFEFRDEDYSDEVTSNLAYEPGPRVEQLVGGLDDLAKGRTGYSPDQARDYLVNAGAALWRELVPRMLREQFWDRQHRIKLLTILADKDTVPWELLYPRDPGHDVGFLVEQFPVTRAIFGRRPARRLSLWPARFVRPEGSLPGAWTEIDAIRQLLDPTQPPGAVISALTPLQDLIRAGDFGLLHFACHNRFERTDGSSIRMDNVNFTPTLMTTAAIDRLLEPSAPTVFMNACRSAGLNATYNRLDGWASKFLEAGAGAFIGSLWAVTDKSACEFAQEFYRQLLAGFPLGEAVMRTRQAASRHNDPTWLAYTVYGNPRAAISQHRP